MASRRQLEHARTAARRSTKSERRWRNGRLLLEGQAEGRDEGPTAHHDEERQAGHGWHMNDLRHQDLQDRKIVVVRRRQSTASRERTFLYRIRALHGASATCTPCRSYILL